MSSLQNWISAARPRTLPLALAGLGLGNFLAANESSFSLTICLFSILTAALLQVLSNCANDYGDYVNGADNSERVGPKCAVQSGAITSRQMKRAIVFISFLAFSSGIFLLYLASAHINIKWLLAMLFLGLLAIGAAYKYTASKNPYGYKGFGDIAVFLFFGLLAVLGSYFLQTGTINSSIILPACAFGLLSTGVLNLNNMRDIVNDKNTGKITIAVRLGLKNAKRYHALLIIGGTSLFLIFATIMFATTYQFLFLIPLTLLLQHVGKVNKRTTYKELNPLLKELSLISAFSALSIGFGYII